MIHKKKLDTNMLTMGLLALNALLLLYVAFFKADAVSLETMKVGGAENMNLVQQLYNSDVYKSQQTQAIQQVLSSINQQANPLGQVDPTDLNVAPDTTEVLAE